ncbi:class I SAM-dependent methyltransferase [Polaribacter sp. PL03]|uniref:O-methyltransferase n=1 Tax=Polaribacter sp. PL03 TaxID=3088353 RepID=UPI0029CD1874|nr:class I SAM-dependent methyltransferase [Polaribacter sp. PL03]MDX6746233.1 class I SAM-dependent methyltransferase [Polaribacter sp. PL03]
MLYQQRKYLQFLSKASNQHGVHSPFVYLLITKCFYKKTDKNLWKNFLNIKQQLLDNKKEIKVTDFGAGSKIFKSNNRKVSKIVKVAGISNKKATLLIKIIAYFKPKKILEIGTSLGLGTSAIKTGNNSAKILTLEGCPETSKVAQELFDKNNFTTTKIITGDFSKTLSTVTQNEEFDCIYFDGNHTKKATLNYFEECIKKVHNNSFFIFDDIYWNKEMQDSWETIKNHTKVTVTIDLFYFGIVFFRKEQAKEHFKIRV